MRRRKCKRLKNVRKMKEIASYGRYTDCDDKNEKGRRTFWQQERKKENKIKK